VTSGFSDQDTTFHFCFDLFFDCQNSGLVVLLVSALSCTSMTAPARSMPVIDSRRQQEQEEQ
jgi:hypothetical protein